MSRLPYLALAIGLAMTSVACGSGEEEEEDAESPADYAGYQLLSKDVCDPSKTFSLTIDNPFFPLPPGMQMVLEGVDEGQNVKLEITVLPDIETVAGVETRVIRESEWANAEQSEISLNYFAQAADGTVCYFGESVDNYAGGAVTSHDGTWRAGENGAAPGIQMPGTPQVGTQFLIENAPGTAQDTAAITSAGDEVDMPAGSYTDTLRVFEWNPLESMEEGEVKYYARGVGGIVDAEAKLTQAPGASADPKWGKTDRLSC